MISSKFYFFFFSFATKYVHYGERINWEKKILMNISSAMNSLEILIIPFLVWIWIQWLKHNKVGRSSDLITNYLILKLKLTCTIIHHFQNMTFWLLVGNESAVSPVLKHRKDLKVKYSGPNTEQALLTQFH